MRRDRLAASGTQLRAADGGLKIVSRRGDLVSELSHFSHRNGDSSWHTLFMLAAPLTLPDLNGLDAEMLKAMLLSTHEELRNARQRLLSRDQEIEHLKLLIAKLRRMQFGRRSEKVDRQIEQLELRLEDLEANRAERMPPPAGEPFPIDGASPVKKRRPLPDHLRRDVHVHLPKQKNCPECGGTLKKLGEDISEMLEYIPASFVVLRHVRPKLSCARCASVVQAPAPSRPIDRGLAGPGLLAHVLTAKFADYVGLAIM
jgi:transposase